MHPLKKIYRLIRPHRWLFLLSGGLLCLSGLIRMVEPKVLQLAIDFISATAVGRTELPKPDAVATLFAKGLPTPSREALWDVLLGLCGVFVVLSVFRAATAFLSGVLSAWLTERIVKNLRDSLFRHIQLLQVSEMERIPTGDMIQRTTGDIDTIRRFIGEQITQIINAGSLFAGAFAMMLMVHVPFAVCAVMLMPAIVTIAVLFFKKEAKVWEQHEAEQDKLTDIVQENLNGIRVVKAFAREASEIERFQKQNDAKYQVAIGHVDLHRNFWATTDGLSILQMAIVVIAGGWLVLHQQISIGEYISFFTYVAVVMWPMRQIGQVVSQMGMASIAMQRISEIADALEEDYSGYIPPEPLRGDIEFRDVSFLYKPDDPRPALSNVKFQVSAGEIVGLMGPAGSGKSTIIGLLVRLYEPTSGQILLDGRPLAEYSKQFLRKHFGVVQQKPFLFSASLRDNIAFIGDANAEQVEAAANRAAIGAFIHSLPEGYDTIIGEKGVSLSGGQKQRISLARTILADPQILVMDDATSAVDTETETQIRLALQQVSIGKTCLIISHRLTTVQDCHRILVFAEGRIVERGSHEELVGKGGYYRRVFDIQTSVAEEVEQEISGVS